MKNLIMKCIAILAVSLSTCAFTGPRWIGYDVCDLDLLYQGGFEFFFPRSILESYLSGKAFDNPSEYSEEESAKLKEDIRSIFKTIMALNPLQEKFAVITAGAPGAGKTTLQRQDLETKYNGQVAYDCPDDVCLKNQTRTYVADIESGDGSKEAYLAAYNKWRPGSNAAAHLILGNLIRENYALYFGSTSTSPHTYKFFSFLKEQGYSIRLLHLTAPDSVRWDSITERDKTFVQSTKEDVFEKGELLPQRIMDTYLKYADQIDFFYRDAVHQDARLAAKWVRTGDRVGTLEIVAPIDYEEIKTVHNTVIQALKEKGVCNEDLEWEETVEKHSTILL